MNSEVFSVRIPYTFIGNGAVNNVGKMAKEFGAKKVLLVTDPGVVKAGLADKVKQPLEEEGIEVVILEHVEPDNPIKGIEKSARVAKEGGCDLMIGLGGGSVMDNVKLGSVLATAEDISQEDIRQYMGTDKVTRRGMPKIMIPTTSGTGAEWTRVSPMTDESDGIKKTVRSDYLIPEGAILDPLMTLNLPQRITADTGMDALSHTMEAYTNLRANLFTDMIEETAIKLIATSLRDAYAKGSKNIEARYNMAFAAMIACMPVLITGAGLIHGMAHSLQVKVHASHGVTCSLMMPPVMEFNMLPNLQRYARIAELMGENLEGLSLREKAQKAIDAIKQLSIDVGMPQRLRDIGMKKEDIEPTVDVLFKFQAGLVNNNPRDCSREDAIKIYEAAW